MSNEVTQLSDTVIPEVYLSYTAVNTTERAALVASGLIQTSDTMNRIARSGGRNCILPFWKDLDASTEPNYSNDDPEDLATPEGVDTGTMNTRKAFVNKGYSEMDLVQELAGASPMQHIRNRFGNYWDLQKNRRLGAIIKGLYLANVGKNAGDMTLDMTTGNSTGSAGVFGSDGFIDAAFTLGDQVGAINSVIVHSVIMARMAKNDDIVYIPDSQGKLIIPTYKGRIVIAIDDPNLVLSGSGAARKFLSILCGPGGIGFGEAGGSCFAFGEGVPKVEVETERNARSGNGGGQETLWERKTWIMHPYGFNWTDPGGADTLTEFSPKWSDLAKAVPWTRVVDRKNVPLAFLVSYGAAQAA